MRCIDLPAAAKPLIDRFSIAFYRPTFHRVIVLIVGAILAHDRRTITACLRAMVGRWRGHASDYHRLFSRSPWSLWVLGKVLAAMVLELVPKEQAAVVPVDDTVAQHRGKRVYGKGCHHDAVRSSHSHVVWKWGHKWVVLAVNVRFPFASRPWALPVLVALYRPQALDKTEHRRHKTPIDLARGLVAVLCRWFPDRRFILLGDGGYASHELARFCRRHRRRLTLVSRLHPHANFYDPPPQRRAGTQGRPRVKGRKRACPAAVVARTRRRDRIRTIVSWYGGAERQVELVSGTGYWYKGGDGLVALRWVFVHDLDGTHRDEYFYSTDPDLTAAQIVSYYTGRWSIEVTFQEVRTHLGFETTKQWTMASVLRMAPCLLGLFSLVSLIYAMHCRRHRARPRSAAWYDKPQVTFSDAMARVRRLFWAQTLLAQARCADAFSKLPNALRETLLDRLAAVA